MTILRHSEFRRENPEHQFIHRIHESLAAARVPEAIFEQWELRMNTQFTERNADFLPLSTSSPGVVTTAKMAVEAMSGTIKDQNVSIVGLKRTVEELRQDFKYQGETIKEIKGMMFQQLGLLQEMRASGVGGEITISALSYNL